MRVPHTRMTATTLAVAIVSSLAVAPTLWAQSAGPQQADASPAAPAQSPTSDQTKTLSTVVVTGTRVNNRTEAESLAPVDVISGTELQSMNAPTLKDALTMLAPSLNLPMMTGDDTGAFVRPVAMRGLSPDETLVLVNGKRWHPSAIMLVSGDVGQGSQSPDLSTIPLSAIDHVEILRDGASAIYGSDAIAGVINIILKGGTHNSTIDASYGKTSAGDGGRWTAGTSFGVPLAGDRGWLRISADAYDQKGANRSLPDPRPEFAWLGTVFDFGIAPSRDKNVMLNGQFQVNPNVEVYTFGHFSQHVGEPRGFYRYGTNTPEPRNPLMGAIFPDGSGFLPFERGTSADASLVFGVRGHTDNFWRWDVSANYGRNRVSYWTMNSVNFAFYDDFGYTPRNFFDGLMWASLGTLNADISKELNDSWTLSFGAQYLYQMNKLSAGDLASYYVSTTSSAPGGAQGFTGWDPASAYRASRNSVSEYVQLEGNPTEKLSTSFALRHEHYSDVGNVTSGAVSARYDFNRMFAVRGTATTGFRAPGLGQQFYSNLSSSFLQPGNVIGLPPGLYETGQVATNNPIAKLLGAEPLKPEKSRGLTVGVVITPNQAFTSTVDLYIIKLRNVIAQSSSISLLTPEVLAYLQQNGVSIPPVVGLSYYTNAGTQLTRGIDWVSTLSLPISDAVSWKSSLAFSYHKNEVYNVGPNPAVLDQLGTTGFQRLTRFQILGLLADLSPRLRTTWSNAFRWNRWTFNANARLYGRITNFSSSASGTDLVTPSKTLVDVSVDYEPTPRWKLSLGANNVFNTHPRMVPVDFRSNGGTPYDLDVPYEITGTMLYTSAEYRW